MSDQSLMLRKTVAEFFDVDEAQINPSFPLTGARGAGSITRASLDAAIRRRVGLKSKSVYSAKTFGELSAELGEKPSETTLATPQAPAKAAPLSTPSLPLACGVDLELLENVPRAADCWTDPFYQTTFSPAEIAYCQVQADPIPHFCARWCAKEALKKCDSTYLSIDLNEIEVAHEPTGAPYLAHQGARLPHALSLSHTAFAAVAMVVHANFPSPSPHPSPAIASIPSTLPALLPTPAPPARGKGARIQALLTLVTLVVAALALYRTFLPAH